MLSSYLDSQNKVAILVGQHADAVKIESIIKDLARTQICAELPAVPVGKQKPASIDFALLIIDGIMLWRHWQWLEQKRSCQSGQKLFVLLLLSPARAKQWPEERYRHLYDDVLQAPLSSLETQLRVHQLLRHYRAEAQNTLLLRQSRQDAENLRAERKTRERLVATLGHDLRSPLTAARLGAERLVRDYEPAERKVKVDRVVGRLDRINTMIEEMLDASRLDGQHATTLAKSRCNLRQLAKDALVDLENQHGNRFVVEIDAGLEARLHEDSMVRVLENLCSNAIKYGDKESSVHVQGYIEEDQIRLQVANRGDPIPQESISRLFGVFERAGSADQTDATAGWGIGLSMVKAAADAHDGKTIVYRDNDDLNVFGLQFPKE